jgi:hypothetical protein
LALESRENITPGTATPTDRLRSFRRSISESSPR